MQRMTPEQIKQLVIGDAITPNAKYRTVYDVQGKETDFFIEEKDILYIRNFVEGGFVVELRDDVLNRERNQELAYGYFVVSYDQIASKIVLH